MLFRSGDEKAIYAYIRQKNNEKVFVILNLSGTEQPITIKDNNLIGKAFNVFKGSTEVISSKETKMKPWGYTIYEYKSK